MVMPMETEVLTQFFNFDQDMNISDSNELINNEH